MASETLRDELSNDPLGRGYSTMTDSEAASDLNTAYRTRQKASVTGGEVWDRTEPSEFSNLVLDLQQKWLGLCGVESFDPYGPAEDLAVDIFGSDSVTISNLADFRVEDITRAEELGLGEVLSQDVHKAREQLGLI